MEGIFLLRNMATGSISILFPQHPTFQKVVTYFHKSHLNPLARQGPISYPCIWFIWAAVKRHPPPRSKLRPESWASREARVHRLEQGTNTAGTSRLWLLSPRSAEASRIPYQRENSQEGQSTVVLEQTGARGWKVHSDSSEHLSSVPLASSHQPLFLSLCVRLQTYFLGPSYRIENWKQAKGSGHSVLPKI